MSAMIPDLLDASDSDTGTGGFDHGPVSSFNAWFFTAFAPYLNHVAGRHKRQAFAHIAGGTTVEIGAGTGANLRFLPRGTRLVAVEPSLQMHERLVRRCHAAGIDVTVVAGGAEAIPLPDGSVDEVICSLVLCTVDDPDAVLSEVRRILRPGGRFRFVEHVAAPRPGVRRAVQRIIRRPWGWLFEGCDPGRHTVAAIERAGFGELHVERRRFRRSLFFPVNTAVWGVAVR
jgi:ubiquinone/menaquinone biosynthesis C-methylase UbiE